MSVKIVDELCPFDSKFSPEIEPHSLKIANLIACSESRLDNTVPTIESELKRSVQTRDSDVKRIDVYPNGSRKLKSIVQFLAPSEFHQKLLQEQDALVLDVRNYYESQMGHFQGATLPPIRKFSSLPKIIKSLTNESAGKKTVLTYCTGGIRCEMAARMIHEVGDVDVCVLEGGIHNYLEWTKKTNSKSLFLGSNYVFDARRIVATNTTMVSTCRNCAQKCNDYTKCAKSNCHLIVPCCEGCRQAGVKCCGDCKGDSQCSCENERRRKLFELMQD